MKLILRAVACGALVTVIPMCMYLISKHGVSPADASDLAFAVFGPAFYLALFASWITYAFCGSGTAFQALESSVYIWFWLAYITHLTWEPGWMFMHRDFKSQLDSVWIFGFSAYFPGDDRYLNPDNSVYIIETLSICNGIIGMYGLYLWGKNTQSSKSRAAMIFLASAAGHIYSTSMYYAEQIMTNYQNVAWQDPVHGKYNFWLKFVMSNSPWIVMPWFVLAWAFKVLDPENPNSIVARSSKSSNKKNK